MTQHTLFVCVLCRSANPDPATSEATAGQSLLENLNQELKTCAWQAAIQLQPVRCMGACSQSCVVAFAAPNKLTFILRELAPLDAVPELLKFSEQYIACSDGRVPYKERPETVKKSIHAVLPPLPLPGPELR